MQRWTGRVRNNAGVAIGFLAQALQYGAGLMMVPFLVTRLSPTELGIWYVFVTAQGLATVADFGFQPTLSRAFSLAFSGVRQIEARGFSGTSGVGEPNMPLVQDLLRAARRLYLGLAGVIFLLLIGAGMPYLSSLAHTGGLDPASVRLAWLAFAAAIAASLYFLWIPSFLLGSGRVGRNYLFLIFSRGGIALFGLPILIAGGRLTALALGYLASQVFARLVAIVLLRGALPTTSRSPRESNANQVLRNVWPNASRLGLVGVGAFLITRLNVFVVSSFVGLAASASYALSLQLFYGIASIAQLPIQMSLARIVRARVAGNRTGLRRMVGMGLAFFAGAFCIGAGIVIVAGQTALNAIGSHVSLLAMLPLALLGMVILLEGFHSMCAFVITTSNQVPFVAPALLSGGAIAILSTLAGATGWGIVGVIACQGLVQLAYNNWQWPLRVYRELAR